MKSKIIFFILLLLALFLLLTRSNHSIQDHLLDIIDPIKKSYRLFTQSAKDRSESYIFQKEHIQKLTRENKALRKYLLDQTHYLSQVSSLFQKLPSLEKLPHRTIDLVNTVSYIRLNSFDEVLLTRPKKVKLEEDKLYGLIQNDVVGGTAVLRGEHLYGYLTSSSRCRFGVFIGKSRAPGIARGVDKSTMAVSFIPKWSKIDVGDKVETSGLDGIFFANLPVGIVKEVKIENSYKTAYIKTYDDTLHPNYYFMIADPSPYLVSSYDRNNTFPDSNANRIVSDKNESRQKISSIPETVQTKETVVNTDEFEIPKETPAIVPPKPPVVFRHPKQKKTLTKQNNKTKVQAGKPKPTAIDQSPVDAVQEPEIPATVPPQPKQKKRKSAMDFINGR
jgi:rod shape-determining protein MreC